MLLVAKYCCTGESVWLARCRAQSISIVSTIIPEVLDGSPSDIAEFPDSNAS
jgi:hypothetical protein